MPVSTYPGPNSHVGNGVTTVFAYSYRILEETDLLVLVDGVQKALTTDYTVAGEGDAGGGSITFLVAPANLAAIVIARFRAYKRDTDYQRNGSFDEETVDGDFDSGEMQIQQLAAAITRAFKPPIEVTADQALSSAQWAARHGLMLGFDSSGNLGVFAALNDADPASAFALTLLDDVNAAAARLTLGFPAIGTDGYPLVPVSGSTAYAHLPPALGYNLVGGYLDWTVSGNVLTVAVKTWAGNDPSAAEPVWYAVRDATVATGSLTYRKLTAALSLTVNNTATVGASNGIPFRLWGVVFNDAGTDRLAIINCLSGVNIYPLAGWGIGTTVLSDNSADSAHVFYAGAVAAAKAYTVAGYATWETGLATAGVWNAGPTRKQLFGPGVALPGQVVQAVRTDTGAVATGTTVIPFDDTIPQITEGDQYMTQAITPNSAANVLRTRALACLSPGTDRRIAAALFQDATANALKVVGGDVTNAGELSQWHLSDARLAGGVAATTMRVRGGSGGAGTTTFNGISAGRLFGGVANSFLEIEECMA